MWAKLSSKTKKIIIISICSILVCVACFCAGRFVRLGVLASSSSGIDSTVPELKCRVSALESELSRRVEECSKFEQSVESIRTGIDESLGFVRQIRRDLDVASIESRDALVYVQELRTRFKLCEESNRELESRLSELQKSIDK